VIDVDRRAIHCPKCRWIPGEADRWQCTIDDCGTVWNTFWTGGVCPGCGHAWRNTECLACCKFSPHAQWYHDPSPGAVAVEVEAGVERPA
jgi:hypothetical protein